MSVDEQALRQIFERLGSIDARLEAGGRRHDEFHQQIVDLKIKIEPLPLIIEVVRNMKPIVDDYVRSRNKFSGIVLACGAFLAGVGFWGTEFKAFIVRSLSGH